MKTERMRDRFMPWGGLALGTIGFFITHQLGSDAVFQDCKASSPWLVIVAVILGLALVAAGALMSYRVFHAKAEGPSRKLAAAVSLAVCALYVMGIILPLIAALIIPQCWA